MSTGNTSIEVKIEKDIVCLKINPLSELFERGKSVISRYINKIFNER